MLQALVKIVLAWMAISIVFMGAMLLYALSQKAEAACRYQWVDHDYSTATPARRVRVCDDAMDRYQPALPDTPSVRPIQRPQVRPLETPGVAPLGTSRCRNRSIWQDGKWVTRRLCD